MSKTTKNKNNRHSYKDNGWTTPTNNRKRNSLIKIFVPKSQATSTTASVQNHCSRSSTPVGNREIGFSQPSTQDKLPITPENKRAGKHDFSPLKIDINENGDFNGTDSNRELGSTPHGEEGRTSERSSPSLTNTMKAGLVVEERKDSEPVKEEEDNEKVNQEQKVVEESEKNNQEEKVVEENVFREAPPTEQVIERVVEETVVQATPNEQVVERVVEETVFHAAPIEQVVERVVEETVFQATPIEQRIEREVEQVVTRQEIQVVIQKPAQEEIKKKAATSLPEEPKKAEPKKEESKKETKKERPMKSPQSELRVEIDKEAILSTQNTHEDLSAERIKAKEKKIVIPKKKSTEIKELPEGVPVPTKRRDCCGFDWNFF